jgi:hypothetical protein
VPGSSEKCLESSVFDYPGKNIQLHVVESHFPNPPALMVLYNQNIWALWAFWRVLLKLECHPKIPTL